MMRSAARTSGTRTDPPGSLASVPFPRSPDGACARLRGRQAAGTDEAWGLPGVSSPQPEAAPSVLVNLAPPQGVN
jgi:hypothetical protein